jgi:hypothetical protein
MRRSLMLYPAIIALALSLLLTPALPVAAGDADRLTTCDLRFIFAAPCWSSESRSLGINDWREIAGGYTHDSTGFDGFYLDRVAGESAKLDHPGSGTANVPVRALPINNEGNISGRYLGISGANPGHFSTENGGIFLNPIDRPTANSTCGLGVNDQKNTAEAYVNSTNNSGPAHSLSDPAGELATLHPSASIDTLDLSDLGGILGTCLNVSSSLIHDNLSHDNGDATGIGPRGDTATQTGSIQDFSDRDHRHTIVIRCFEW